MKTKYLFITIAFASLFGACSRDEASLFDKSAAQRAQEALDNANDILVAPANGWEMIYFANNKDGYVIGYNVLVKFYKNGKVEATAKNDVTTKNKLLTDSSTWVIVSDYGPILSFDTYNKVLHAWANPDPEPEKSEKEKDYNTGDGYLGDYEFMIVHADANYIKLKGKKHGGYEYGDLEATYCYMYPLKEGTTAATYFSEVEAMQAKLFSNSNLLQWTDSKETYMLYYGSQGYFDLVTPGMTPSEDDDTYPFAVTRTGIHMSNGIHTNTDVVYTAESNKIKGETSTITIASIDTYFKNYIDLIGGKWIISLEDMCPSIQAAFEAADNQIKTIYNNKKKGGVKGMVLQKKASNNTFVLAYSYVGKGSTATTYYYRFKMECTGGRVKLTYLGPDDENAAKVIETLTDSETLIKSIEGDYNMVCDEAINPTLGIKMTNNSNAGLWIKVTGSVG